MPAKAEGWAERKSRVRSSKLNRSSKTKTPRAKRKKDKKQLSLNTVRVRVTELMANNGLLLTKVLDETKIDSMVKAAKKEDDNVKRRKRTYTPHVTLVLFVQQMLSNSSCKQAVLSFNETRKAKNLPPVSTNTTSYCEARERLPVEVIRQLMVETQQKATANVSEDLKWFGHNVRLVDGFVNTAPDTPDNQSKYPQPTSQKPGLGFPQIRNCALFCLATGMLLDVKYDSVLGKMTGEQSLFRKMIPTLSPGDVVVGDSNFESYRDMATLKKRGVYAVCDINGTRESPFTGTCTTIDDKDAVLNRPGFDPSRFTREEWEALPQSLNVRFIRYKVSGRKTEITIMTTLLDRDLYTAEAVAELYKQRWQCEVDIRSIKSLLGLSELSCHTPEMLERELLTYYLAYNLVCVAMSDAAKVAELRPRDLSFKNAKDSWLRLGQDGIEIDDIAWLLWSIAHAPLRKRPGRREPRKRKRRSGKFPYLPQSRTLEKAGYIT